jgi:predicted nuclease of predicted toxin-antitoxin system
VNDGSRTPSREALFDENVSTRLVDRLTLEFPGSEHVRNVGLRAAEDQQVWEYARAGSFAIVSKDTDFRERSFVEGFPPKVIWLDVGNAGTAAIADLLRSERERIERFETMEETSLLILSIGPSAV